MEVCGQRQRSVSRTGGRAARIGFEQPAITSHRDAAGSSSPDPAATPWHHWHHACDHGCPYWARVTVRHLSTCERRWRRSRPLSPPSAAPSRADWSCRPSGLQDPMHDTHIQPRSSSDHRPPNCSRASISRRCHRCQSRPRPPLQPLRPAFPSRRSPSRPPRPSQCARPPTPARTRRSLARRSRCRPQSTSRWMKTPQQPTSNSNRCYHPHPPPPPRRSVSALPPVLVRLRATARHGRCGATMAIRVA